MTMQGNAGQCRAGEDSVGPGRALQAGQERTVLDQAGLCRQDGLWSQGFQAIAPNYWSSLLSLASRSSSHKLNRQNNFNSTLPSAPNASKPNERKTVPQRPHHLPQQPAHSLPKIFILLEMIRLDISFDLRAGLRMLACKKWLAADIDFHSPLVSRAGNGRTGNGRAW